ncbi:MAG: SCO family protein [Alphaproteobacteria bacterium]|nr:SCO family protein [Alphaproteobacteria bacterium]MDX5415863.1 SCO family protein [Alphaproteobacteria bacterium]MDX5493148.1 SCO family protein [Alphaproteobacteria bacterium]
MTRNGKITLAAAILFAIVAGIALSELVIGNAENRNPGGSSAGAPSVGGPFTLVNHLGETVTEQDFRGRYMLMYFGFTFCPDVCPTELGVMAAALNALGDKGEEVTPVLISIDPERDTPEVLARYVALFHPRLVGLTGTPEQVDAAAKAWHVYYAKVEDESVSEAYTMDHSSIVFLMGPDGEYLKLFRPQTPPDEMAREIATFLD